MTLSNWPAYLGLKRDFKAFATLCDDNIIMKDGWRIGKNECSHMGMRFMTAASEIAEPCVIRCQYHGRSMSSFKLSECGEALLEPNLWEWPFYGMEEITSDLGEEYQTIQSLVECPAFLWLQNTMDPGHVPYVHEGFQKVFRKPIDILNEKISGTNQISYYEIEIDPVLYRSLERHSSPQNDKFRHWTVAPMLSVTSFCGIMHSVESVVSTSEKTCQVTTRYFSSIKGKPNWAIIKSARENNKKIIEEDISICERVAPTFKFPRFYLEGEGRIKAFHTWMKQNL